LPVPFPGLLYSRKRGSEDEFAEKIQKTWSTPCAPKTSCASASCENQGGHQAQGSRKDSRTRRAGVHSDPANARKTAQGINRTVHQGQPPELAEKETKELAIIESYLPAGASEAEMDAAIAKAISESGANSVKQMARS